MKKILVIMAIVMCISTCSCSNADLGSKPDESEKTEPEIIELTENNILNYVKFDGEFVDGKYTIGSLVNWAEATLEFQAYPIVSGKFNSVDVTLICTSNDPTFTYMNDYGNYWHLANDNAKEIRISFTLSVDGEFSKKYSVKCSNNTGKLDGDCNFIVTSVSGTFIPD